MKKENLEKLINNSKYQVFLFQSKAHFPLITAHHFWFVINKKGTTSRWEITFRQQEGNEKHWGYLHKNAFSLFQGLPIFSFSKKFYWPSELLNMITGEENSTAQQMVQFIENSPINYPYNDKYSLFGPNCGTYIKWVLDANPNFGFKLKYHIGINYNQQ